MTGAQVALIVVGLAVVGGGVFLMTRKPVVVGGGPKPAAKPSQSLAGSLISQLGGRALSYGIDNLGSIEDSISSFFG